MVKTCSKCGKSLPLDMFRIFKDKRRVKPQVRPECKECEKQRRNEKADHYRRYQREWKRSFYKTEKGKKAIKEIAKANVARRKLSPPHKVSHRVGSAIYKAIKRNKDGYHWETLVGYTLEGLMNHLERQFTEGMTWENYGSWHIDHKIPISVFNFGSYGDIDFKKCWALKNLQPMWASENIRKHARLEKPFQPALRLSYG